jgi:hypothetical protein
MDKPQYLHIQITHEHNYSLPNNNQIYAYTLHGYTKATESQFLIGRVPYLQDPQNPLGSKLNRENALYMAKLLVINTGAIVHNLTEFEPLCPFCQDASYTILSMAEVYCHTCEQTIDLDAFWSGGINTDNINQMAKRIDLCSNVSVQFPALLSPGS